MKSILYIFILILPLLASGQNNINGIVLDYKTKEALPFATLRINKSLGSVTDTDGKFQIDTKYDIKTIEVSYIGYTSKKIEITPDKNYYQILLKKNPKLLNEVVLVEERENPALRIIRNTIANKNINNPQKVLNNYQYNSYAKFVVTAQPDSIKSSIDSVWTRKDDGSLEFRNVDSSNYNLRKTLNRQHLYLTEKISTVRFEKGRGQQEEVLASRMAGLKEPLYEFLALNIQSFSFYDDYYSILGTKYINPIAGAQSLRSYDYQILDTIQNLGYKTFMIYFKPKKKEKTAGLEGLLYIDERKFAIEKTIVELKAIIRITGTLTFNYNEENKIWFPKQVDLLLRKGDNRESLMLMGNPIEVGPDNDSISDSKTVKQNDDYEASDYIYLSSKSKYFDVKINEDTEVKNASLGIIIDDDAHRKDEEFWNKYRTDSIDKRALETYVVIDSIAEEEGIDKQIKLLRSLSTGFYPTEYFDFNLNQFLDFNRHEGFRIGVGGKTSDNISSIFNIEPYVAYGTRDNVFKGGSKVNLRLNKVTSTWIGISYSYDVNPSSLAEFKADDTKLFIEDVYRIKNNFYYSNTSAKLFLRHNLRPNFKTILEVEKNYSRPEYDYQFVNDGIGSSYFDLSLINIAFNWEPYSKFIQSRIGRQRIEQKYPVIGFQYQHSLKNILGGDYNFDKFNLKIHQRIETFSLGTSDFYFKGGIALGDAPLPYLYSPNPNSYLSNPWILRVNFSGDYTFETMMFREFFSDKYFEFHFRQTLRKFNISKNIKPRLAFVSRLAFGELSNPEKHQGIAIQSFDKGYYESGLELKNIYFGFGFGAYYRYGFYAQTSWDDNLFIKINYKFSIFN